MDGNDIKRVLVYTHNSIGLGHAFRTLAVLTGMKKWRPDIDFLVVSGTSIPHLFFQEGIEVIKLPSIKLDIDKLDNPMSSRYLSGFDIQDIFDFRQRIILATFDFFQPDVFIVEHNMTGQMSELIPLLMKKWMRKSGPGDFALVHICRGIMKWAPLLKIPYQNPRHRSESINIGALYDLMYVLEDREVIDINRAFLGNDPELEKKIAYLGKITNRVYEEAPSREETLLRFCLPEKPIILISLGRNRRSYELTERIITLSETLGLKTTHQIAVMTDPYVNMNRVASLKERFAGSGVRFLPFIPDLVDLMFHSELIISRAGYNTINEILLTGIKALIIPESHGGGEQELRARSLHEDTILTLSEEDVMKDEFAERLMALLDNRNVRSSYRFNKYEIGKRILDDVAVWQSVSRSCRC